MSKAWRKGTAAAIVLFVAALMIFLLRRPVWLRLSDPAELVRPSITVFNPLRNRAPERIAEQMLNHLRRGDVDAAMAMVHDPVSQEIADKERRYRLRRWKLVDRVDRAGRVTLYYRTDRGTSGTFGSEVLVFLQRQKRDWLIRGFQPTMY